MPLPQRTAQKAARSRRADPVQVAKVLLNSARYETADGSPRIGLRSFHQNIPEISKRLFLHRHGELRGPIPKPIKRLIRRGTENQGPQSIGTGLLAARIPDGKRAHQLVSEIHLASLIYFHTATPQQHEVLRRDEDYRSDFLTSNEGIESESGQLIRQWFTQYVEERRVELSSIAAEQLPSFRRIKELEFLDASKKLYAEIRNTAKAKKSWRESKGDLKRVRKNAKTDRADRAIRGTDQADPVDTATKSRAARRREYEQGGESIRKALDARDRVVSKLRVIYEAQGIDKETIKYMLRHSPRERPTRQVRIQAQLSMLANIAPEDVVTLSYATDEMRQLLGVFPASRSKVAGPTSDTIGTPVTAISPAISLV